MKVLHALIVLIGALASGTLIADPVKITAIANAINNSINTEIMTEVYRRADVEIDVMPVPSKRGIAMVKAGQADGEISRVERYGNKRAYLHRLNPAINQLDTIGFVRADSAIRVLTSDTMPELRVGVVRGIAHAKAAASPAQQVIEVDTIEQLVNMLDLGRIDLAIHSLNSFEIQMKKSGLSTIRAIEEPLASQSVHHYLRVEKTELIQKIEAVLAQMKASGELDSLAEQARLRFMSQYIASK